MDQAVVIPQLKLLAIATLDVQFSNVNLIVCQANGTFIVQPSMTEASGKCEATKAELKLAFTEGSITLSFNKVREPYIDNRFSRFATCPKVYAATGVFTC